MQSLLNFLLPTNSFMPHGYCFLWQPGLLWLLVASHLLTALAYFSIPLAIAYFLEKRSDIVFKGLFRLFSGFILCCGITHVFAVIMIWQPYYALEGILLAVTAAVSLWTAVVLWTLIPKALLIPSPAILLKANQQLQDEIFVHQQTKAQLTRINADLDRTITLLQASNQAYQESEQRFKAVVNLSPAAIYTSVLTDKLRYLYRNTFVSDAFLPITGFTPQEWHDNRYLWVDRVHPEDLAGLLDKVQRLPELEHLDMQYRFRHKDGTYRWVYDKVNFLPSLDGLHDEVIGAWMDITEAKKNEEEMRLAAITFNSLQGIMITDAQTHILRVNPAFSKITGYTAEEVVGKKPTILRSGLHNDAFYDDLWQRLDNEGRFEGEVIDRRKDGALFTKWQSITALKNSDGVVTNYVSMFTDISEKKKFEEHIKQLAFYDPLTNLPNRRLLEDKIEQVLTDLQAEECFFAILFLDLDHFKWLNDSLGHHAGDELLKQVAGRLRSGINEQDTAARFGGDEFVILLNTASSLQHEATDIIISRATQILYDLNQPYHLSNSGHYFSTSIGITLFSNKLVCLPEELLQQADTAMYRSKAKGRNTISFFDYSMQEAADRHLQLESNLRLALQEQQFTLYYQPQVDANGEMVSAEALIRWLHPLQGLIAPSEFIPLAEDTGLIVQLGQWVLSEACQNIKRWSEQGLTFRHIAVNVSAKQFQQSDFVEQVAAIVNNSQIDPRQLMLELTESGLIDNILQTVEKMRRLKKLGLSISIDDFGTGYSSLAYLTAFPLSQLKIDRSFVNDVTDNRSNEIVVETIIHMADNLGLEVIAEGVETQEQVDFLLQKGCKLFQGYYFSRPVPAQELAAKWLRKPNGLV
ncbi:EAL domain-containing protein [Methylovulum psychrotolerans]|uniref:bifunctional diguanylate cyclase/phosphodiesterase n=1 Tax=Methylovulum psychrotolerans TaxID=1704499 RepID=UPI001BFF8E20|nr:bifunctional diguanylate cyclase/phosphodiesterase [Methylovulum psychrotolerans]MBT9097891.1 EAL domain-containing protein [Methylovulum psychrotolerans]